MTYKPGQPSPDLGSTVLGSMSLRASVKAEQAQNRERESKRTTRTSLFQAMKDVPELREEMHMKEDEIIRIR